MIIDKTHTSESDRWDTSAEEYATLAKNVAFFRESASKLVQSVALPSDAVIADVGCGSSGLVQRAIFETHPNISVLYCVDVSPKMLRVLARAHTGPRIRFIHAKAERLSEIILNPIDTIFVNSAIWLFNVSAALEQFERLLRHEGQLAFTIAEWDLCESASPPQRANQRYELIEEELHCRRLPPKKTKGSPEKYSLPEIAEALEKNGFSVEEIQSHETIMTMADWTNFYSIKAIASRSLPYLRVDTALEVLTAAIRRFAEYGQVDSIAWKLLRARRR